MGVSTYIGTLSEDLWSVAWRIHRLPGALSITVWFDERGDVYASEMDAAPTLPHDRIIGSYRPGRSVAAIEDDLCAAMQALKPSKT